MQRSRNFLWLIISYGLALGLIFDPTRVIGSTGEQVSLQFSSTTISITLAALLLGILVQSNVLSALGTFTHELGHSIAVGLTGGNVNALKMKLDTSGSTSWSGKPMRLTRAFVAISGPLANAIVFSATVSALQKGFSANALLLLAGILALITITSIRNIWGWVVSLTLTAVLSSLWLVLSGSQIPRTIGISEIPTEPALILILAVVAFNSGNALRYSWKCRFPRTSDMDEYKLSKALGVPTWFGGHFVLALNLFLVGNSIYGFASLPF